MISKDALQNYLDYKPPEPPEVKGADTKALFNLIHSLTGEVFEPKTQPWPHQLEAVAFAFIKKSALLYLQMRLGKTKISLDWASHLKKAGGWQKKGLIICSSPVLRHVWAQQIEQHSYLTYDVVDTNPNAFIDALQNNKDFIIASWSSLQGLFAVKAGTLAKKKLRADKRGIEDASDFFDLTIIDEIHTCSSHLTLRFQIASILVSKCAYRLGLTGTPFGRHPLKVWAQSYLIDEGKTFTRSFYFFEQAFGTEKINYFTKRPEYIFDPKKKKLFEARLDALAIAYETRECHELPEVVRNVIELKMTGLQLEEYKKTREELIKEMKESKDGRITTKPAFIRLRQISSGFLHFVTSSGKETNYAFPSSAKMDWLNSFLEEMDPELSVVIFHEFIKSGELICKALAKHKIKHTWLYGGTKDKKGVLDSFTTGKTKVLVANTVSGGVGIDLSCADYLCFYETPVSAIIRSQAEARPMGGRGGRVLMLDDLICSNVERKILGYVQEGKDALNSLVYSEGAI